MSLEGLDETWSDDAVLDGRLRLVQPRRGHRFGHDSILLAAATGGRAGEHVIELGAGVGTTGLALAFNLLLQVTGWATGSPPSRSTSRRPPPFSPRTNWATASRTAS